jgi:uncharacterized protein YjiS (DUF1127 family)
MGEICANDGPARSAAARESGWAGVAGTIAAGLAAAASALAAWRQRRRSRLHLMALDDHLLRDIGISRADMEQEVFKPFWMP